jgi:predicted O-methyltransferase YrrM
VTGGGSSLREVQQLLAVLAADRRCTEIGTAFGEGAAAIARTARSLVTVERDNERAAVARSRLREFGNVELIVGDWRDCLPERAPFEFVFFDGGRFEQASDAIDLLAPGGFLVKDDLTPGVRVDGDPVRKFLFHHPELLAVEVQTTPSTAAVIAVRRAAGI